MLKKYLFKVVFTSTCMLYILCTSLLAEGAGTTALNFLKIGTGARAVSLGESYVSLSDDVYGIFYNPAGLMTKKTWSVGLEYNKWFEEINQGIICTASPQYKWGGLGYAISYLSITDIDGRDVRDNKTGLLKVSDTLGIMTYTKRLKDIGFGLNFKYVQEALADKQSSTFIFDWGIKLNKKPLSIGFSMQNIGSSVKFEQEEDNLPLISRFGWNYKKKNFMLINDITNDEVGYKIGIGSELIIKKTLFLRAGYKSGESLGGLRGGLGFSFKNMILDYAFSNYGELDYVHRISLKMDFKKTKKKLDKKNKAEQKVKKKTAKIPKKKLKKEEPKTSLKKVKKKVRKKIIKRKSKTIDQRIKEKLKKPQIDKKKARQKVKKKTMGKTKKKSNKKIINQRIKEKLKAKNKKS